MTATADASALPVEAPARTALDRADGVQLMGDVDGSGYKQGAALVRRGDGQVVQLGRLMYALLNCVDGRRDIRELAAAMSAQVGRSVEEEHVQRLAQKLAAQGLLAGTEQQAPPRRNPLLALRWKVLVTDPTATARLTAPFTFLFRPWVMWPLLACFAGVFWFVLVHKGVAAATAQAFNRPALLLLVFVLGVASAGFHELGHAAACRYGGATPGGMGIGLYLVWPAFYTDVTDAYRLPRRDRLRVDLGGLYFNAVVAVVTLAVWLVWRADALLLLVALQVLQMVKQLSPVIRADGYHILSDATGVPDLYLHMGPTLRRLIPGRRREPSALCGWARALVTAWTLIVVPVLLSLMLSAVLLLPKLVTSAWDSGRHIALALPHEAGHGQFLALLASLVRLLALSLPVLGSGLVTQRFLRTTAGKARTWSAGRPARRAAVLAAAITLAGGLAWAWWPAGQYQPVRAREHGTIGSLIRLVSAPATATRPSSAPPAAVQLTPGTRVAVAMIPVGGASREHPALFLIAGSKGQPPVAILSYRSPRLPEAGGGATGRPAPAGTTLATTSPGGSSTTTSAGVTPTTAPAGAQPRAGATAATSPTLATAFPFKLPRPPGPRDTQALALNTTNGGVVYEVAYALVTLRGGAAVTETNSAYALADCRACTTVAVSFQVVLVIGQSRVITPVNAAGALNYNCPACSTTAIADQIVVTLKAEPTQALFTRLESDLKQLNALPALGTAGSPAAVAAEVTTVQHEIESQLSGSGLEANSSTTPAPAAPRTSPVNSSNGTSSGSGPDSGTAANFGSGPSSASGPSSGSAPGSSSSSSASLSGGRPGQSVSGASSSTAAGGSATTATAPSPTPSSTPTTTTATTSTGTSTSSPSP